MRPGGLCNHGLNSRPSTERSFNYTVGCNAQRKKIIMMVRSVA